MTLSDPQRVLVVEDEYFLADDLKKTLEREGVIVVGPVANEAAAMNLLAEVQIDCAILDINLDGHMVYPLARTLRDRNIPFLFVTGYDVAHGADLDDVELIQKPFTQQSLLEGIHRLTNGSAVGPAQAS